MCRTLIKYLRYLKYWRYLKYLIRGEQLNIINIRVYGATELSEAQLQAINSYWKNRLQLGKATINLQFEVKPELLAGFVMYYEDTMVDTSLLGRVNRWQTLV